VVLIGRRDKGYDLEKLTKEGERGKEGKIKGKKSESKIHL